MSGHKQKLCRWTQRSLLPQLASQYHYIHHEYLCLYCKLCLKLETQIKWPSAWRKIGTYSMFNALQMLTHSTGLLLHKLIRTESITRPNISSILVYLIERIIVYAPLVAKLVIYFARNKRSDFDNNFNIITHLKIIIYALLIIFPNNNFFKRRSQNKATLTFSY